MRPENVPADLVEVAARAIDQLAFAEWTASPRGLECTPADAAEAQKSLRQQRAKKQARAALAAALELVAEKVEAEAARCRVSNHIADRAGVVAFEIAARIIRNED